MAFQTCPGVASATLEVIDFEGDVAENVLHVYKGAAVAWTTTELTTLANGLDTWSGTGDGGGNKYTSEISSADTLSEISCRDLTTASGPEVTKSVSHAGAATAAKLNSGISKALTLRSGLSGKSNRGRVYLLGLTTHFVSTTDPNYADATALANQVLAWGSLIAAVVTMNASWSWCILSRRTGGAPRANGVPVPIISVGFSHTALDFQRRRAPAHARHR